MNGLKTPAIELSRPRVHHPSSPREYDVDGYYDDQIVCYCSNCQERDRKSPWRKRDDVLFPLVDEDERVEGCEIHLVVDDEMVEGCEIPQMRGKRGPEQ
uniref:Uncharacterized protein n=1 Tax=Lepeophtheirus salmonis TaxID=72036 RepID=A0A0K2TTF4_LEPSM